MIKELKFFLILSFFVFFLAGCGCYSTYDEAWAACNKKYNGKCRFLGDDFQVCTGDFDCGSDADCEYKYGSPKRGSY